MDPLNMPGSPVIAIVHHLLDYINQSIKFYICVPSLARLIRCLDKFILAYVHVGGLISTDASTWDDKAGMLPPLQRPLLDIAAKVDGGPGHHRWVDEAQPLT